MRFVSAVTGGSAGIGGSAGPVRRGSRTWRGEHAPRPRGPPPRWPRGAGGRGRGAPRAGCPTRAAAARPAPQPRPPRCSGPGPPPGVGMSSPSASTALSRASGTRWPRPAPDGQGGTGLRADPWPPTPPSMTVGPAGSAPDADGEPAGSSRHPDSSAEEGLVGGVELPGDQAGDGGQGEAPLLQGADPARGARGARRRTRRPGPPDGAGRADPCSGSSGWCPPTRRTWADSCSTRISMHPL